MKKRIIGEMLFVGGVPFSLAGLFAYAYGWIGLWFQMGFWLAGIALTLIGYALLLTSMADEL